jgi:ubiquinol-cytochrome c reductase iron-sulfur subunit
MRLSAMTTDSLRTVWWESAVALIGAVALVAAAASTWAIISHLSRADTVNWAEVVQVDLAVIEPGTLTTVEIRGRPVHVLHRTPEQIALAQAGDNTELQFPERDEDRLRPTAEGEINPEFLIVYASETGRCITSRQYEGFFDPCLGTKFDFSGRFRSGSAEGNLEVPPYAYASDTLVFIGLDRSANDE